MAAMSVCVFVTVSTIVVLWLGLMLRLLQWVGLT